MPLQDSRSSPIPGVTWGFRDLVLGVVAALVVFFVLGATIVGSAMAAFGEDALETLLAEAAAVAVLDVVLVVTVLAVIGRKGAGLRELGFAAPRQGWPRMLGYIVLAYFAAIGAIKTMAMPVRMTTLS